jgi:hypothetical protein
MTHRFSFACCLAPVFALLAAAPGPAAAQGYTGYPYSMASATPGYPRRAVVARGSSGSVLPTPLPRTQLIPPEGRSAPVARALPQEQPPTVVPGLARPIPNLSHGPETFQDRASRCAFQQGINGVPGTASNRYMGACLQ